MFSNDMTKPWLGVYKGENRSEPDLATSDGQYSVNCGPEMSDSDTSTLEPDPKDWELQHMDLKYKLPHKRSVHDISDSDEEPAGTSSNKHYGSSTEKTPSFKLKNSSESKTSSPNRNCTLAKNSSSLKRNSVGKDHSLSNKDSSAYRKYSPGKDYNHIRSHVDNDGLDGNCAEKNLTKDASSRKLNTLDSSKDKTRVKTFKTLATTAVSTGDIEHRDDRSLKRKLSSEKSLKACPYGSKCYRKNPAHFIEFSHPDDTTSESKCGPPAKKLRTSISSDTAPLDVFKEAHPISFFLTRVHGIPENYNGYNTMDLKSILSPSMGDLQASCQFNYMFEIPWLVQQYPAPYRTKPLLCVHGFTGTNKTALESESVRYSHIKFCQAKLESAWGTHHTKMMFLLYSDGLRIVIHTANLIQQDWHQKTQGIWISPKFPKLKDAKTNHGDSATNFKKDLLEYLMSYRAYQLKEWQEHIQSHDMTDARVFIIASSPGRHTEDKKHAYGHMKLRRVLSKFGPSKELVKSWPVTGQFSSIGSLGPTKDNWLCTEFLQSLATVKNTSIVPLSSIDLKLIFPTKDNVRRSLEGYPAGASIPYSIKVATKQPYLHSFFHHWKSSGRGRTRAMPHIKSYSRLSPEGKQIAWYLVTSSNLSKAAWGALEKKGTQLMIRSYEIGVLFLPEMLDKDLVTFSCTSNIEDVQDGKTFLMPYDVPLMPYDKSDRPWIWDIAYKDLPDSKGNMWCPS